MLKKPTKLVTVLLPMDIYEKLKCLSDESGWPLSRYLRQMMRRYLRWLEEHGDDPDDWWRI